jgi:hypothetical protein
VVAKKHNFRDIQQKIPQTSNFAKKRDSNPPPHGDTAADIAKIRFQVEKHYFCNNPIEFLQNSPDPIPKIGFREKLFFQFSQFFRYHKIFVKKKLVLLMSAKIGFHEKLFQKSMFFVKIGVFCKKYLKIGIFAKIGVFCENRRFLPKIFKNWRFAKIGNFAKIGVFAKIIVLAKIGVFAKS